jgi:molybdenum transport protein
MPYHLSDIELERLLEEDVPYGDLTTSLLGIGGFPGKITFTSRERTVICCTEDAARILEKCGASISNCLPSGSTVDPGTCLLAAAGSAGSLHAGWKVALNLLEYASGIASRTSLIVERATAVQPHIAIVTTRKSFPGTKKIALKAIMAGGAFPHRLGLSESILVFRQHTAFLGGSDTIPETVSSMKVRLPEHKIVFVAETPKEALQIAASGVDIVQVDKIQPGELAVLVKQIRQTAPGVRISAAGGINAENAAAYAAAGVDILVLSSVYFGKPADIAASIHPC